MELTDIPGIGPAKADALKSVGIKTVQDLAAVDLRKPLDVNVGSDVLRSAKQEARKLLKQNGIEFETANYKQTGKYSKTSAGKPAARPAAAAAAKAAPAKKEAVVSFENKKVEGSKTTAKPGKKNLLARIFARN